MPIQFYKIASFQDENLKEFNCNQNILSILYSQDGFSFAIYQKEKNKFLALEAQRINTLNKNIIGESFHRHLQAALKAEYENSLLATFKDHKTVVNIVANQSTLVPLSLFDEQQAASYLQLNYHQIEGSVKYEINNVINAVCVYSVYESVIDFFKNTFSSIEIHSLQNTLSSQFQKVDKKNFEEIALYCYVEASQFFVNVFNEKKLIYSNQFRYQTSRDFVFYILSIYENLGLQPDTVPLIFSGDIFNDAEIWQLLWKYLRHIRYLKGNDSFSMSHTFNHFPPHQFFHLFNAVSCVLLEDCGSRAE
ncbi:MAG: DUF3822 family protein [Bacteroidales bacterium]|nr:DUF3822 family protein [Bacteroidales bacterium]